MSTRTIIGFTPREWGIILLSSLGGAALLVGLIAHIALTPPSAPQAAGCGIVEGGGPGAAAYATPGAFATVQAQQAAAFHTAVAACARAPRPAAPTATATAMAPQLPVGTEEALAPLMNASGYAALRNAAVLGISADLYARIQGYDARSNRIVAPEEGLLYLTVASFVRQQLRGLDIVSQEGVLQQTLGVDYSSMTPAEAAAWTHALEESDR